MCAHVRAGARRHALAVSGRQSAAGGLEAPRARLNPLPGTAALAHSRPGAQPPWRTAAPALAHRRPVRTHSTDDAQMMHR
eukprot:1855092-Prymnesium_polylepis.1